MKTIVVTKSPVDLDGAAELVGAFSCRSAMKRAIAGPGTYTIATMDIDRLYAGDLLDVEVHVVLDHRQVSEGISPSDCLITYGHGWPAVIETIKHLPTGAMLTFKDEDRRITKSGAIDALAKVILRK